MKARTSKGFTLIELLIVVAIIGILASVVLATLNSARLKARDAKRASEMQQIVTALHMFYSDYGCLPITHGTSCAGAAGYLQSDLGGWDYSSQGGSFMSFLQTAGYMPTVPIDPVNNMTTDGGPTGTFGYRYFCFSVADAAGKTGPVLGYWKESTSDWATAYTEVLSPTLSPELSDFDCK